ncbi:Derlin [Tolypocladium capitatum]|uniref:Derlin n=1 Tax=Tolypocladium capitatum TaxID=45235 RepID=A0A2K3Q8K0_9HYPO|nr:Derlin [Tolypocladium capitatum]
MPELSLESYWQLPPMSRQASLVPILQGHLANPSCCRTIATAAFLMSIGVHMRLMPAEWFLLYPQFIWKMPPELWRFGTAFLLTGPNLSLLFDTYFLYSYMSQLEIGNPGFPRKEDLVWYLMFTGGTIVLQTINYLADFGFVTFLQALTLAMCYTMTQGQRGMQARFMFITIPAQLTPYAMLLFNLMFPGGLTNMLLQVHGLLAAHLFHFLTRIWPEYGGGSNLIPTPAFLSAAARAVGSVRSNVAGAVGIQLADQASGRSTGASGGPLPDSWGTRGRGHRLG